MILLYQFLKGTYYFLQPLLKEVHQLLYDENIQSVPELVNYLVVVFQKMECSLHLYFQDQLQPTVLYAHFESAVHY